MDVERELPAAFVRSRIEVAMRAEVSGQRFPEIVWTVRVGGAVVLLGVIAGFAEIGVEQTGDKFLSGDRRYGRSSYPKLPARVSCGIDDGLCGHLRLEYGRNRLRLARQSGLYPTELGRI